MWYNIFMKIRTIKQIKDLKDKRVLMRVDFNVAMKNNKIVDVSFEGEGCAISIASASMLTDYIKGKIITEINKPGAGLPACRSPGLRPGTEWQAPRTGRSERENPASKAAPAGGWIVIPAFSPAPAFACQ